MFVVKQREMHSMIITVLNWQDEEAAFHLEDQAVRQTTENVVAREIPTLEQCEDVSMKEASQAQIMSVVKRKGIRFLKC